MTENLTPRFDFTLPPLEVLTQIRLSAKMSAPETSMRGNSASVERVMIAQDIPSTLNDNPKEFVTHLLSLAEEVWDEKEAEGSTPKELTVNIYKRGTDNRPIGRSLARLNVKKSEAMEPTNAMIRFRWEHYEEALEGLQPDVSDNVNVDDNLDATADNTSATEQDDEADTTS